MTLSGWILCMQIIIPIMVFSGLIYLGRDISPGKAILQAYETICVKAEETSTPWWNYEKWNDFLTANGGKFHYGEWINPVSYMAVCCVIGMCGLAVGVGYGFLTGIFLAVLGAALPGILLEYLNKADNEKMLGELDLVYSALAIQIRAGVHISDALMECYSSVSQPRLYAGLKDLCSELVVNAELDKALAGLQKKFNNKYIDTLCITILQACESGQAIELLGDIAEQIKDMEVIIQQKKKGQLDRSTTFYQLGIFVISLGLTLYLCVTNMFSAAIFFN